MQKTIVMVAANLSGFLGFALEATAAYTPAQVAAQYVESLKKADLTEALSLTAQFPNLSSEGVRGMTTQVAAALRTKPLTILSEPSKALDDCAVVIGKQSAIDLDPVLMLRQGGQWRVLPTVTDYDDSSLTLSEDQRRRFKELLAWFNARHAENYRWLAGQRPSKNLGEPAKVNRALIDLDSIKKGGIVLDKQVTLDVNDVAAAVPPDKSDSVAHFLVFGTSALKGESVISAIIAKNELNKIDRTEAVQLPLARLMQRIALRTESAQDARHYAFAKLRTLGTRKKAIKDMLLRTATEISKREKDDLKGAATNYLRNPSLLSRANHCAL